MGKEMKPLKCGICTTCCRWGTDTSIRPMLLPVEAELFKCEIVRGNVVGVMLAAKPNGDCHYLGHQGCTIYESRPEQCKNFDCRVLYKQMREKTFIKVILAGKRKLNNG